MSINETHEMISALNMELLQLAEIGHPLALFSYGKELYEQLREGQVATAFKSKGNVSKSEIKAYEQECFNKAYDYLQ